MPKLPNEQAQPYTDARLARDMTGLARQLEQRAIRQPSIAADPDLSLAAERLQDALQSALGATS